MKIMQRFVALLSLIALITLPLEAKAQSNEERFQDLFTTAGYATAFGAALGAAVLSFQRQPERHLRYVAIGASLGFISGSIIGSYIIFSPTFATTDDVPRNTLLSDNRSFEGVMIRPTINTRQGTVAAVEGAVTLLSF